MNLCDSTVTVSTQIVVFVGPIHQDSNENCTEKFSHQQNNTFIIFQLNVSILIISNHQIVFATDLVIMSDE